ncbi:RNA-directed DNA polymerase, eukaryota, reverse transcriptase zinc-binding domain protein [Tanacetum coccineum]
MAHDLPEGVVRFTNENDEVAYKMPHKIEQYNSLLNLEKEHTKSVYLRNEEDKRRGVDYVMSKILGFYKECLELGPEYVTGMDGEGEVTLETASQDTRDAITIQPITASEIWRWRHNAHRNHRSLTDSWNANIINNKVALESSTVNEPNTYHKKDIGEGYSQTSKAYIIFNKETLKVNESFDVTLIENISKTLDDRIEENQSQPFKVSKPAIDNLEKIDPRLERVKEVSDHLIDRVMGDINKGILRSQIQNNFFVFISTLEPKSLEEALKEECWTMAMHHEINQLTRNNVWYILASFSRGSVSFMGIKIADFICLYFVFVGLRVMDTGKLLKSCLKKVSNIDGKVLGKDGKPMKVVRNVQPVATAASGENDSSPCDSIQKDNANDGLHATSSQLNVETSNPEQVVHATAAVTNNNEDGDKKSFASTFKAPIASKAVRLTEMKNDEVVHGANVAILLAAVEEVSSRFQNTLYGYFIEGMESVLENGSWLIRLVPIILNIWTPNTVLKKDTITSTPVWIPIQLLCAKSHREGTHILVPLVEVSSESELKESLLVAIPFPNGKGHSLETVEIEYEWQPPRCGTFKILIIGMRIVPVQKPTSNNGEASSSNPVAAKTADVQPSKPSTPFTDEGINLVSLCNSFDSLMERDKVLDVDKYIPKAKTSTNEALGDDDEEVEEMFNEEERWKANVNKWASTPSANVTDVMHVCIYFKADKKEMFCSFVCAHNRYVQRRELWQKLVAHKSYIRNRSWCLLGDFNVSLHADEKSVGSSYIDTGMRDFQEYVGAIEMSDVNSTGLRFTWNQTPKGKNGVLKKIDRIMANLGFYTLFVGSSAIFQPYHSSDHSPTVLRVPMISLSKPRLSMVKRLKLLKNPLRKLLYDHGNLHENVNKLRHELDTVQIALDRDPNNIELQEEEAAYLLAFNEASLLEENFLMQKAKVEWLKLGNANTAYFHKVVKSQATRNRIDSITTTHGLNVDGDQEIKDAMFAMGDNRAPGPDGYTAAFFKGT